MAKKKDNTPKYLAIAGAIILFLASFYYLISDNVFAVLSPVGPIALAQKNLLLFATGIMLLVIIPVYIMAFWFAYKYREGKKSTYEPKWDSDTKVELTWWAIPFVIIFILGIATYQSSHALDPFKPLDSSSKTLEIQVVALQYKWLFIYPEQKIASVNFAQIPKDRPVSFTITSDAPMNSFWVPQLGGQIYAMPGMSTKLNLQADEVGDYRGVSANLSGEGFAGMDFVIRASNEVEFLQWTTKAKLERNNLDEKSYTQLAQPSSNNSVSYFRLSDAHLYDKIIMNYMMPTASEQHWGHGE